MVMNTEDKISEGLKELNKPDFYQPNAQPMVDETAVKVKEIVDELSRAKFIYNMTHKCQRTKTRLVSQSFIL